MAAVLISVAGTTRSRALRVEGMAIREYAAGQPNTLTCRVWNFTPVHGQEIKVGLTSLADANLIFGGIINSITTVYEGDKPTQLAYDLVCQGFDAPQLLNRRKVIKKYTATSASTIAAALITDNVQGFPAPSSVEASLASVAEITFTNDDVAEALDQLAKRVGAIWYIDYAKDLHFFVTSTLGGSATAITDAAPGGARAVTYKVDISRCRTRAYVEGLGSSILADVAVGQTSIPVDDSSMFNGSGGTAVLGPQRVTYTGKSAIDGNASQVAGATVSVSALTAAVSSGVAGGLQTGAYLYKVTMLVNSGESAAGTASSSVSVANVSAPTGLTDSGSVTATSATGGGLTASATYQYELNFYTARGTTQGGGAGTVTLGGGDNAVAFVNLATSSDARVIGRRLYRVDTGIGGDRRLVIDVPHNSSYSFTDKVAEANRGDLQPSTNASGNGQMALTSIPTGAAGTTGRRIYRTAAGGSEYRLVGTIHDNSTTTFTDRMSDDSRGAVAPAVSTAGEFAASTTLNVADLSKFNSGGGWVRAGNQVIRYTGRSASSGQGNLTGVPSSGIGAIASNINTNSQVVALPSLEGVPSSSTGSVLYAVQQGDPINLLVTRNDTSAQTALATLTGYDGIVEEYIRDNRLSETEAAAFGDARLAVLKDPLVTVRYETRDTTAKPGRTVAINIASPPINATFRIQAVTVTGDQALAAGTANPLRQVEASSQRFSFEQVLALIRYDRRL